MLVNRHLDRAYRQRGLHFDLGHHRYLISYIQGAAPAGRNGGCPRISKSAYTLYPTLDGHQVYVEDWEMGPCR